jgi:hypothetical protein
MDPEEATAFFIPYDIGFDASIKKVNAMIRPQGCPNAEAVIKLLEDNKYFRRNYGYDHFLVQGLNQAMAMFNMRWVSGSDSGSGCSINCFLYVTDQRVNCF